MRQALTKTESLAMLRRHGYVRIDDSHSATTEAEIESVFGGRQQAWDAAKQKFATSKIVQHGVPEKTLQELSFPELKEKAASLGIPPFPAVGTSREAVEAAIATKLSETQ